MAQIQSADVTFDVQQKSLICQGSWIITTITHLQQQVAKLDWPKQTMTISLNGTAVEKMDTVGAWFLIRLLHDVAPQTITFKLEHFAPEQQALLNIIGKQAEKITHVAAPAKVTWLAQLGKQTFAALELFLLFFNFIGASCYAMLNWLKHPARIQWRSILNIVESSGFRALPIVGLLVFLIGVVLTYQMGLQLRNFGANIFIVNLLGLSMLREFAPLITSIIIAGRSGSAFTAQLGTMKANEEMDALQTMGISPMERLVLPRLVGLMIALPLLTIWSDLLGVLGGMVMSKQMLNIHYADFLQRFQETIKLKTLLIGILKAPIFALLIGSIGCFQGFQVTGSAESVGRLTTRSVVQGIFLIICMDALFSVLLSWCGI